MYPNKEPIETRDVGLLLIPISFVINGTSSPLITNNLGDEIVGQQVTRSAQGTFTFAFNHTAAEFMGFVPGGVFGASGDMYPQCTGCDPVGNAANNCTIKTLTGAVATDPANGSIVCGLLMVKKNTRRASR